MSAFSSFINYVSQPANSTSFSSVIPQDELDELSSMPWSPDLLKETRFFFPIDLQADRWNLTYPYRLVVIDTFKRGNPVVNGSSNNANITITPMDSGGILHFEGINNTWAIQLPITPEQLKIIDQTAIQTSATLRGILEEHNGIKFKQIMLSGTFGSWPSRSSVTKPPGNPSIVSSLFGGTIEAFGDVAISFQQVLNSATTGYPATKPKSTQPGSTPDGLQSTGYFQALAIQQFLEQYAEQKKDPNNAGWRLVFDIPKQNQSYIVTPVSFAWEQDVNKPLNINYSMEFKAWRRINLQENIQSTPPSITQISPGVLQRILSTISSARELVSNAYTLVQAVRSDFDTPLEALRQTSFFVKDLAGVAISAADLPSQIINDYKSTINQFFSSLSFNNLFGNAGSNTDILSSLTNIQNNAKSTEGLSLDAVSSGQLGGSASNAQSINPANNIYSNPQANFLLFDQVPVNSLTLSYAQQNKLNNLTNQIRAITTNDLKQFRATILQLALQLSNYFGAGSSYYNNMYNLSFPTSLGSSLTLDNYDLLKALYDTIQSYDILTATTSIDDQTVQTNMEYVAGLANLSGIPFTIPNSMILAPVPFGLSIEQISARYLGDAQRWIEIATLNNLKDPYIDETGFQYYLLSNGIGRQVTINSNENLYLGQQVILYSNTQIPSPRTILEIAELSSTSYLITLDGEPDLNSFLLSDNAYLQAYLPGTVNSQQKIFIPSDLSVPNDPNIVVPASTSSDPLTGMSKVDWLLTDDGDLATNNYGDFRYSYGLTNIVQALKIKFGTQAGTVLLHPEFGLGLAVGAITSDVNPQHIYTSIDRMIKADPRFSGVKTLNVVLNGNTVTINVAVTLANQNGVFPITFKLT